MNQFFKKYALVMGLVIGTVVIGFSANVLAHGNQTGNSFKVVSCDWDFGCWINPLAPDGATFTTTYVEYNATDGSPRGYHYHARPVSRGGCCNN